MASTALNEDLAARLREASDLLEQQGANPFRVMAYRRAAQTVEGLEEDLATLVERRGIECLPSLPGIGRGIAAALLEMLATGRWSTLDQLRGTAEPARLLQRVPGIGPTLARRIHEELHVDSLEALEVAAHDGRLEAMRGVGPRRTAAMRAELAAMLGRAPRRWPSDAHAGGPDVQTILDVDREYREKATEGRLPTIAPRRFNPSGEAWLPVLHADRGNWHFTALFSNTARAHELGRTRDWVVIFFYDSEHREGQHTVVTERRGPLAGRRVVRGREAECTAIDTGAGASERVSSVGE